MKIAAISNPDGASEALNACQAQGYIVFVYKHADPELLLLRDKFLYVGSDKELDEKIKLLRADFTITDTLK
jgi:hypothetical protein